MTQDQVRRIRETEPTVCEMAGAMSQLFYGRLFLVTPALRSMFHGDIKVQGRKFSDMLGSLLDALEHLDRMSPVLRQMGQRHTGYGVKAEYYGVVASAFLWALSQTLEADFTPEVRAAWTALIGEIAAEMQAGAQQIS